MEFSVLNSPNIPLHLPRPASLCPRAPKAQPTTNTPDFAGCKTLRVSCLESSITPPHQFEPYSPVIHPLTTLLFFVIPPTSTTHHPSTFLFSTAAFQPSPALRTCLAVSGIAGRRSTNSTPPTTSTGSSISWQLFFSALLPQPSSSSSSHNQSYQNTICSPLILS